MNITLDLLDTIISNPKSGAIMIKNKLIKEFIKESLLKAKLDYRIIVIGD